MGASEIINIILGVLALVFACVECREKVKGIVASAVNSAINYAEFRLGTGEEKMETAIKFVQDRVPAILKPFVTKEYIRKIIQIAFDKVEQYVETQIVRNQK